MRIMYVEDNAVNLGLVRRIAKMGNHEVISYTNGPEALTALEHEKVDLILMDIELEGEMDGIEVVKRLRARGDVRPIVAVTAYAMVGDKERILEAGCNGYLPKPLPVAQFLNILAKYDPANMSSTDTTETAAVKTQTSEQSAVASPPATPPAEPTKPASASTTEPAPPAEASSPAVPSSSSTVESAKPTETPTPPPASASSAESAPATEASSPAAPSSSSTVEPAKPTETPAEPSSTNASNNPTPIQEPPPTSGDDASSTPPPATASALSTDTQASTNEASPLTVNSESKDDPDTPSG